MKQPKWYVGQHVVLYNRGERRTTIVKIARKYATTENGTMMDISEEGRMPMERNHGKLINPYSMYTVPEYEERRYINQLRQRLDEMSRHIQSIELSQLLLVGDAIGLDRPTHLPKEIDNSIRRQPYVEQQTPINATRIEHAYRSYDDDKKRKSKR